MPDESPLVRQWILLRTLCARHYGATVKEMSQEMGVSDKTIRRDLETFQRAGFPLDEMVGDYGRKKWRIDPARSQPGMTFTFDEAIALHLGRRLREPLAGIRKCWNRQNWQTTWRSNSNRRCRRTSGGRVALAQRILGGTRS